MILIYLSVAFTLLVGRIIYLKMNSLIWSEITMSITLLAFYFVYSITDKAYKNGRTRKT